MASSSAATTVQQGKFGSLRADTIIGDVAVNGRTTVTSDTSRLLGAYQCTLNALSVECIPTRVPQTDDSTYTILGAYVNTAVTLNTDDATPLLQYLSGTEAYSYLTVAPGIVGSVTGNLIGSYGSAGVYQETGSTATAETVVGVWGYASAGRDDTTGTLDVGQIYGGLFECSASAWDAGFSCDVAAGVKISNVFCEAETNTTTAGLIISNVIYEAEENTLTAGLIIEDVTGSAGKTYNIHATGTANKNLIEGNTTLSGERMNVTTTLVPTDPTGPSSTAGALGDISVDATGSKIWVCTTGGGEGVARWKYATLS